MEIAELDFINPESFMTNAVNIAFLITSFVAILNVNEVSVRKTLGQTTDSVTI